jgi:hypothetical protein
MSVYNTYGITFSIDRDYFETVYNNNILYNDESLEEAHGNHFEIIYLRDFGTEPTCIINIYEINGPEIDIIPVMMTRLHIQRDQITLAIFSNI